MKRQLTKLDEFAQILIERSHRHVYPGEYEYSSTAARLIIGEINAWYSQTGLTGVKIPSLKTAQNWFYDGCPPWVLGVLSYRLMSGK